MSPVVDVAFPFEPNNVINSSVAQFGCDSSSVPKENGVPGGNVAERVSPQTEFALPSHVSECFENSILTKGVVCCLRLPKVVFTAVCCLRPSPKEQKR